MYVICPCSLIPIYFPGCVQNTSDRQSIQRLSTYSIHWRLAVPALAVRYVMHTICPRHPVCWPKPGKSSSGGLLTTSREFHPNCRSDRAAPIACSCIDYRAVAGREYHYHSDCHRYAGSNPALTKGVLAWHGWNRSLVNLISMVHRFHTIQLHGVPCCGSLYFRTSELTYLTNGYSVVKEH